ncbi:hypothetical protein CR513_15624, partial [Mucuna pruriens]
MTIQLENRNVVQPLGVLEDVLVQVNELIFSADFYVLDMKDETSGNGSTLISGRPFLMTTRTKIDVHVGMLSMEFGDTLVQFNIFEAIKHPTKDHSLFGIDLIDELVDGEDILDFDGDIEAFDCLGFMTDKVDHDGLWEVHNLSNSEDDNTNLADLSQEAELFKLLDQVCKHEDPKCSNNVEVQKLKVKIMSAHLVPNPNQVGQLDPKATNDNSSSLPPPIKLKPLPSHLKYTYLDTEQQLPVIIANNLHQEHEDKLLHVLRQHKKAIRHKPLHLHAYNFNGGGSQAHKSTAKKAESDHPIRGQERSDKIACCKDHLPHLGQLVNYKILNHATRKDHFPLPFIDQVLEKLAGKSHYYFLDGFSGYILTQDYLHLPIRYLCVHTHAVWPMQCIEYVSKLHDKYLLGLAT